MITFALLIINLFVFMLGVFTQLEFDDGLGGTMSFTSIIVFLFLLNISFIVIKKLIFNWNHSSSSGRIKS